MWIKDGQDKPITSRQTKTDAEWLSLSMFAKIIGVSRQRVSYLVSTDRIDSSDIQRVGRFVYIHRDCEIEKPAGIQNPEGYVTVTEYAKRIGVTYPAVRYWMLRNRIEFIEIGGRNYIKEDQEYPKPLKHQKGENR